jgi:hypothetical protein
MREDKTLHHLHSYCRQSPIANPNCMSEMSNFRETTSTFFRSTFSKKASLTAAPTLATTMPTCLGGFDPPPPTLAQMILTALPVSVLTDLGNPNSRSLLASQFRAGNTPDWYINLAPAVKGYVESVQTHTTIGCSINPTLTYFGAASQANAADAGSGGSAAGADGGFIDFQSVGFSAHGNRDRRFVRGAGTVWSSSYYEKETIIWQKVDLING